MLRIARTFPLCSVEAVAIEHRSISQTLLVVAASCVVQPVRWLETQRLFHRHVAADAARTLASSRHDAVIQFLAVVAG